MQFEYPHSVDMEEARQRLGVLGTYLTNRHGIAVEWTGNQCTIDGKYLMVKIEGVMKLEEANIRFDGRDPGMLWRRKAISYLKEKLEMYLDLGTALGDLPTEKF